MKYILSILLSLLTISIHAEEIFPAGCKPLVVQGEVVKLSAKKPALVMIHNLSAVDLWITHPGSDAGVSAGWSSRLQGGHWSALALDKKSFELSCIESRPGHEQQVPCAGLLAACQWSKVKMAKSDTGTFWAGEDMSLASLLAHVGSRGFVLPASATNAQ